MMFQLCLYGLVIAVSLHAESLSVGPIPGNSSKNSTLAGSGARPRRDDAPSIRVTTIEEMPYVIVKDKSKTDISNFEGFVPDLLNAISHKIQVGYEYEGLSNSYGELKGQQWSGMVGELVRKEADLAAAPITISDARKAVIDFTEPIMDIGLKVLYKKPATGQIRPFNTLAELASNNDIKFGAYKGGMTEAFLRASKNETLQKIWRKIDSVLSRDRNVGNVDGAQEVRSSDGNFFFFMESETADYYKNERPCELETFPIQLDKVNKYAFGVKKDFQYKRAFDDAIREMKANGKVQELRDKWWKGECVPRDAGNSIHPTVTSASLVLLGALLYFAL